MCANLCGQTLVIQILAIKPQMTDVCIPQPLKRSTQSIHSGSQLYRHKWYYWWI